MQRESQCATKRTFLLAGAEGFMWSKPSFQQERARKQKEAREAEEARKRAEAAAQPKIQEVCFFAIQSVCEQQCIAKRKSENMNVHINIWWHVSTPSSNFHPAISFCNYFYSPSLQITDEEEAEIVKVSRVVWLTNRPIQLRPPPTGRGGGN